MVKLALIAFAFAASPSADTLDSEELLSAFDETDSQYEELIERLHDLRRRPIDLNKCSPEDLLELPFLTFLEAHAIVEHRERNGPFGAADSLRKVSALGTSTVDRLLPFVVARPHAPRRSKIPVSADLLQRWTRKLELSDGFRGDSTGYVGDPNVVQTRLSLRFRKLTARATLDKDAGEPFEWGPRRASLGYDFLAGHLALNDVGPIRNLVLGDFTPRFAHGLLLRRPGDRAGPARASHASASIRPYASASESGHFRGAALELAPFEWLTTTAFASVRRLDASVDTTGDIRVISRRSSGLHRTAAERGGRDILRQSAAGGMLRSTVGPVVLATVFFTSRESLDEQLDVKHELRTTSLSISAGVTLGSANLAGEYAPDAGWSAGIDLRPGSETRIGVGVQRASKANYVPTSAFAGGSDGLVDPITSITGTGRHGGRRTSVEFSLEHAVQPAGRTPFSSGRSSVDVLFRHMPSPWLRLTLRATMRRREDRDVCNLRLRCVAATQREALRLQLDYVHSPRFECRVRAEYVRARDRHHVGRHPQGILLYQEVRSRPWTRVQLTARIALFSAGDHSARLYAYETDLTYAFSTPSFAGRGRRSYIHLRWRAAKMISIESKWSTTVYADVASIGSGHDMIRGDRAREIRLQIRLRMP